MKQTFRVKRFAATAAALAMIIVGGAYAAGRIASTVTHSDNLERLSYSESVDLAQDLYVGAVLPETLSNGFTFDRGFHMDTEAFDEANGKVAAFTEVGADYKSGAKTLHLSMSPAQGLAGDMYNPTMVNGTTVYYVQMENLFVPGDYKPTADEIARQEAGTLNIGYGADSIERTTGEYATFESNSIRYTMYGEDTNLGKDAMLEIAAIFLS